jgi:hypothetical protein
MAQSFKRKRAVQDWCRFFGSERLTPSRGPDGIGQLHRSDRGSLYSIRHGSLLAMLITRFRCLTVTRTPPLNAHAAFVRDHLGS